MIVDTHMHWPVCAGHDTERFFEALDRNSIDRAVVSGMEVFDKTGPDSEWNTRLAETFEGYRDRVKLLGTVYLVNNTETVLAEAERCIETLGMAGFKLHPWLQGETIFRDSMYALCRFAGSSGVPVMFHDGTPPYALSSQIGVLAAMFPETIFILGHSGILHYWQEALMVGSLFPNVYLTLCGGHPAGMTAICREVDASRIIWGSDYVGCGMDEYIVYRLGLMHGLDIKKELLNAIFEENALNLYWKG